MAYTTSTSSTPNLGLYRSKSQVFVEIPPSPLFKARVASTQSKVDYLSTFQKFKSHKENAPPLSTKISMDNMPTDKKPAGKRKGQDDNDHRTALPDAKKAKMPLSSNENESVACHQCRSKKQRPLVLQCTGDLKKTGNRCKASYCDSCLRNRYGKELKTIVQFNSKPREGNCDAKYHFICPRCEGTCNCAPCRKRRGLAAVGKFSLGQSGESVREILEKNPQALGLLPKNTVVLAPKDPVPSKVHVSTKAFDASNGISHESEKPSGTKRDAVGGIGSHKKLKPVTEPVWAPVPQTWTKQEVEDRIHLREFILRFNPILNIGLRNIEELDDFTTLRDPSTKAILLSLLDLLAIEDDTQKKRIQEAVKLIRSLGLNWRKIASVLYDLRNDMPNHHAIAALPDLRQSDVETSHHTRGAKMQGISADQLLPLLLYLIQIAGEGASVRQELEEGYKQAKEVRASYLTAMREETNRWAAERTELVKEKPGGEDKAKTKTNAANPWRLKFRNAEAKHKAVVTQIQNSHKPEMDWCAPRFTSLGSDTDGRTYYTLSASGPQKGKKERLPGEGERFALKRWGWFIAVFGKPGSVVQHGSGDDADGDESGDDKSSSERWWGFADVEEMRKLSKWLAYCAETDTATNSGAGEKSTDSSALASATTSTLGSRFPSTSGTTAISRSNDYPTSSLSKRSKSRSDESSDHEMDIGTVHDRHMTRPTSSAELKALAKAVLEFANFVDWRLNRDHDS